MNFIIDDNHVGALACTSIDNSGDTLVAAIVDQPGNGLFNQYMVLKRRNKNGVVKELMRWNAKDSQKFIHANTENDSVDDGKYGTLCLCYDGEYAHIYYTCRINEEQKGWGPLLVKVDK